MEEKALREVLERLARIETKLDNYESVRDKADKAYSIALKNEDNIRKMEATNKWSWGFMITIAISCVGYLISKL
ncbi:holin [Lactococcus garvieae subsp. garvieae]|uniref:hemolysin XhlA family protein n=1 Tax=Lactococcus garvieae TaxID=1363 RepID=UPI0005AA10C5|nr:hemolysin XhlA family protein [Lactococcus garvieae]KAA8713080.1 holin [Lactococcus garvieae subsp. garvieae]MDG6192377.1 hemolysin XhlA family protein [Lactococcus garvieae]PCR98775.1 hypothetical protein RU85_GL001536 [Lactococcus garvieae]QPR49371.1 hemolysin XhlA family protein [Lactococcus garvieae]